MIDVITVYDFFGSKIVDIAFDCDGDAGIGAGIMTAILEFCNDSGQEDSWLYSGSSHIGFVCGVNRDHELVAQLHKGSGGVVMAVHPLSIEERANLQRVQGYDLGVLVEGSFDLE